MNLLHPGDAFPPISVALPGDEKLQLPDAVAGDYAVVLLFRGSWCPYCNAQLKAFQRADDKLRELGVTTVVVLKDTARGTPYEGALTASVDGLDVKREEKADAIIFTLGGESGSPPA